MSKPVVALVGRPNVGKSTLFNKLVGKRLSIVEDTPGVTRDRIYADVEWRNVVVSVIDTGGLDPKTDDFIFSHMRRQTETAIETADVIVLVTDFSAGLMLDDVEVALMLKKTNKPVVLCVNKMDNIGKIPDGFYEFYNLGIGDPIAVSSVHGHGTGDLLDRIFELLPEKVEDEADDSTIKVAVIGKPNVGKSSLVNYILGEDRMIVSDIPGTTRDAIDTMCENESGKYMFIDTAGLRKKSKIDNAIEAYSALRSHMAVERAQVCLIMIDAKDGVTEQDTKIAGLAHESGKGCIIVVNKWDSVEKDDYTMNTMKKKIMIELAYMSYAPVIFISAKTGMRVGKLFELINSVDKQNSMRVSTGMLNETLNEAVMKVQPPTDKGKRLKILYMTQVSVRPPTFVAFVNSQKLFHYSYQRYLENQLREVFGFEGTPIRMIVRERQD